MRHWQIPRQETKSRTIPGFRQDYSQRQSLEHLTNSSTSSQPSLAGPGKIDCGVNLINGSSLHFFRAWTLLGLELHCLAENQSGIFQTAPNCRNTITNNLSSFPSALGKSMLREVRLAHRRVSKPGNEGRKMWNKEVEAKVPDPGHWFESHVWPVLKIQWVNRARQMLGSVTTETDHSYGEPLKFSPASRTSSKDDMNYQKKKKEKKQGSARWPNAE